MKKLLILSVVLFVCCGLSMALPITVANHSFEAQVLDDGAGIGGVNPGITSWDWYQGNFIDLRNPWSVESGNVESNGGPTFVSDGQNAIRAQGWAGQWYRIGQDLGATIQANTDYTITADVFVPTADSYPGGDWFTMNLRTSADVLLAEFDHQWGFTGGSGAINKYMADNGYAPGEWFTVDMTWNSGEVATGEGLRIELGGSGTWTDNVHVSAVPEPATMVLLSLGGLLLRYRKTY